MFERYTESARRVLYFAREEVSKLGGSRLEPEHILLGLLREDGRVERLLADLQVSAESVRKDIERRSAFGAKLPQSTEIPLARATKNALQFAAEEADRSGTRGLGVEHLLLGLLREDSSMGPILASYGLRLEEVRQRVAALPPSAEMFSSEEEVSDSDQAIVELRQRVEAYDRCWVEGRPEDVRAFLHPDVVFTGRDFQRLLAGIDACVESYVKFVAEARIHDFKASDVVVDVAGGTAVMTYRWTIDYEWQQQRSHDTGQDLLVWARAGGTWLICWRNQRPDPPSGA